MPQPSNSRLITPLYQRLQRPHLRLFWEAGHDAEELDAVFTRQIEEAFRAESRLVRVRRNTREAYRVGPFLLVYMNDFSEGRGAIEYGRNTGFFVPRTRAAELWLMLNLPASTPYCVLYHGGRPLREDPHETLHVAL